MGSNRQIINLYLRRHITKAISAVNLNGETMHKLFQVWAWSLFCLKLAQIHGGSK